MYGQKFYVSFTTTWATFFFCKRRIHKLSFSSRYESPVCSKLQNIVTAHISSALTLSPQKAIFSKIILYDCQTGVNYTALHSAGFDCQMPKEVSCLLQD